MKTAAAWVLTALVAAAQPSAFTYQGSLSDGGSPANGDYDIVFDLVDAASGGGTVGSVNLNPVTVTDGVFTVELDYGFAPAWIGFDRWLEISVRPSGSVDPYTDLTPAQPVNSVPYANFAATVNASGLIGQVSDANLATTLSFARTFSNPGNVFFGDGANLTALNASAVGSGTLADVRLSANVPLENTANTFSADQVVEGKLTVRDPGAQTGLIQVGGSGANGDAKLINFGDSGFVTIGENGADDRMELRAGQFFFNSGSVGINSADPVSILDVIRTNGGTDDPAAVFGVANCGAPCGQPAWTEAIRLHNRNTNGRVGLGFLTDTSTDLAVVPNAYIGTRDGAGNTDLRLATRNAGALTDRVYIEGGTGDVGIGTTNPTARLDVNGSMLTNGFTSDGNGRVNGRFGINVGPASNGTFRVKGNVGDNIPINIDGASGTTLLQVTDPAGLLVYGGAAKSSGGSSWAILSDQRLKTDVKPYKHGLKEILALQTVSFRYKDSEKYGLKSDKVEIGFLAQDVQKVIPEAVTKRDEYLSLSVDPIHWAAINAIQEIKKEKDEEVASLQATHEQIQAENEALTSRLTELEAKMAALATRLEEQKLEERSTAAH